MSLLSVRDGSPIIAGTVAGGLAYLLGLAVIAGAGLAGAYPATGVWERSEGIGVLLVHHAAHLPVWQFSVQWTLLPYTAILAAVLVLTGFVLTENVGSRAGPSFQTGSSVAAGYFAMTFVGSIVLVIVNGAVTPIRVVAPTFLVGVVVPGLLGGIGGVLSHRDSGLVDDASQS